MTIIRILLLAAALFVLSWLSGCAERLLIQEGDVPDNAGIVRCTQYDGTTGGLMTATSIQASGCQCVFYGTIPDNVTINTERCTVGME